MPVRTIRSPYDLGAEWAGRLKDRYVDRRHWRQLVGGRAADVLKPDGSPLLLYRPNALPEAVRNYARPSLRRAAKWSQHRRMYSRSVGFQDCRKTEFTRDDLARWRRCLPFVRAVDAVFRRWSPDRYSAQRAAADRTDPRLVIGHTAFTTGAVNRWTERHDARTRVHKDKGDLPEGFGVIAVLRSGSFSGGELVFPRYGVAIDLREGDVLLADVHEFHGNAPIAGEPGWERIAVILYYQTAMLNCGAN